MDSETATENGTAKSETQSFAKLMAASRKKLLDLSMRNRLLNYSPADPDHRDDGRAHKFLIVRGYLKAVWDRLVDDEKQLRISRFDPDELRAQIKKLNEAAKKAESRAESEPIKFQTKELQDALDEGEEMAKEGHVWVENIGDEAYQKRLRRLKDEAKTLEDGTGDSAFFLAIGFLKWRTREMQRPADPSKDGGKSPKVEKFAPLIVVKVSLTDEGKGAPGRRKYRIVREDDPQDNQSLKAKLKEEWDFNLPTLGEDTKASDYLAAVKRAITVAKIEGFEVQDTLALGFFNFARYRLWLDLDPNQWAGLAPENHPIVRSIIGVTPLDTSCPPIIDATRDEALADEVARHQEAEDIPIVRDADTSQYTALLYATKGKSIVIIGPPGSGKSQTITNLVAMSIASGKRVLFVAQKLPALDVVASRIRDSGLGEFCLQFYSATRDGANDRRPVSPIEIHQQLTAARNLLGVKPRYSSAERRAPLLAKKLNAYAATVHAIHPVFGETVQRILCQALKSKEDAANAWGEHWDEALLAVAIPKDVPISLEWTEARSRLLAEIARLRHEAGDFWQGWTPEKLTILDQPIVERALDKYRRALKALADWSAIIDPALLSWTNESLRDLAEVAELLVAPENCSDEFLRAITSSADQMRAAHELERELLATEDSLHAGEALLQILPEGPAHTFSFASSHLSEVERCVEQTATYGAARDSIQKLLSLLKVTDLLIQLLRLHSDGIATYLGNPVGDPTISLLISLAQQEDGNFRRAPMLLLPALARRLAIQSNLADEAMLIADRVDDLAAAKVASSAVFSQTQRAEKLITAVFVASIREACDSGIAGLAVADTQNAETACRAIAACSAKLLATDPTILSTIGNASGQIANYRILKLAGASKSVPSADLALPPNCDARLVRAWADGIISEAEAKIAATSHERAFALSRQISNLVGSADQDVHLASCLQNAFAAAETLGLSEAAIVELTKIDSEIARVENSKNGLLDFMRQHASIGGTDTFSELTEAIKLAAIVSPLPAITGAKTEALIDRAIVGELKTLSVRILATREHTGKGAFPALGSAAIRIRACMQAAKAAEDASSGIIGIRRPATLREFRAVGAAIPILRNMPALPVGCDIVQISSDQHAATIKLLCASSTELAARITALPEGTDYTAVPSVEEARKKIGDLRETQDSAFRFFSSRWRAGRAAVKRFAPKLTAADGLKAYELACALRADEDAFAANSSGQTVLGTYFRGTKTDWRTFSAFADWVGTLTKALDGFEHNERVVAAWRSDNSSISGIANACAQFEAAASECRSSFPDFFEGADSPFQADVPVAIAKERAAFVLAAIESLIISPVLALSDLRNASRGTESVTSIVRQLSDLETEIVASTPFAAKVLGDRFSGTPFDWTRAVQVCDWAERIHSQLTFSASLRELFSTCITAPAKIGKMSAEAENAHASLENLRRLLANSRVRPEESQPVSLFITDIRATLAILLPGIRSLRGDPGQLASDMRHAAALLHDLILESTRANLLRKAVAPNSPTTASVEATMTWALSLESHGLTKNLVAFVAEFPNRVGDIIALLAVCGERACGTELALNAGLIRSQWNNPDGLVEHGATAASQIAQGLADARNRILDCGAQGRCTVGEMASGAQAIRECLRLQALAPTWTTALGCDPFASQEPGDAIRETIFWVESLQTDRVPTKVLNWILESNSDERIQAWAGLVRSAKEWRVQRASIRQSAQPEFSAETTIAQWRSDLSERQAALTTAMEQLARVVRNPETTVSKLKNAADSLRQSADAATRAATIRAGIPGSGNVLTSGSASSHRLFADAVADLPTEVSPWSLRCGAEATCAHMISLPGLRESALAAFKALVETMQSYGSCRDNGPGGMIGRNLSVASALRGVETAISQLYGLAAWAALHRELKRTPKLGIDRLSEEVLLRKATPEQAVMAFNAAVAWQKAMVVWSEHPNLERFRSSRHEDLRTEFAKEDISAVKNQNQRRIVSALRQSTGGGAASWGNGDVDQLLRHEAGKRRKLVPVRKLVQQTGKRMQELCPCWFATPAAIAQFMAPGAVDFDIVIMDEASQVTPEDAWGAIARGKQIVVVGDPKQMPPSSFFENAASDDEDDEEEDKPNGENQVTLPKGHQQESVLKAAEASLPQVWLNWHYRSLHQGLIAPANFLSYDRRLVLFPSSHIAHKHLGVRHTYVADGVATTGQVINSAEAAQVVNHLVELAEEFAQPAHKRQNSPRSVGIVAMNSHQQEAIKDLIEARRIQDPFFDRNLAQLESHPTEPFFVRNLENVQGDERDVIIISTTYGPHVQGGAPTQHFNPINKDGGERRWNVLITRAKWRMEVFTSLRSTQLTSQQLGVQHMRKFLEYCESGRLSEKGIETDRWFDSPLEAHVFAVLEAKGYIVAKQIGVAGYFVDLAIKDPLVPDRYVLGIEVDGASYHSSRAARDRDRLREQVLVDRGWDLHRIWSTEWFYNNAAVRKVLFARVEAALAGK
jgi:very-short-patch-repair endonuclease